MTAGSARKRKAMALEEEQPEELPHLAVELAAIDEDFVSVNTVAAHGQFKNRKLFYLGGNEKIEEELTKFCLIPQTLTMVKWAEKQMTADGNGELPQPSQTKRC